MAYDLEEQESIDQMKAWWEKWGTPITTVVCVACLAFSGWNAWQWWQRKQANEAHVVYANLMTAAVQGDLKNVGSLSEGLIKDYPSTVFAPLGALLSAQADYAASDAAAAEKRLEWVATQDKYPEYQTLARYRLAGIQLDKKDYDAAIATLEAAKPNSTERQLVDSRLGDVYAAKGDLKKAREYWKKTADDAKTTSAMKQYALLRLSTTRAE